MVNAVFHYLGTTQTFNVGVFTRRSKYKLQTFTTCKYLNCMYNAFFKNRVILKNIAKTSKTILFDRVSIFRKKSV